MIVKHLLLFTCLLSSLAQCKKKKKESNAIPPLDPEVANGLGSINLYKQVSFVDACRDGTVDLGLQPAIVHFSTELLQKKRNKNTKRKSNERTKFKCSLSLKTKGEYGLAAVVERAHMSRNCSQERLIFRTSSVKAFCFYGNG